jgi:hypothetical protein
MLENLANWGEFIGGMAVVISLIYVGVQIRETVKQARVDSLTKITELWAQYTALIASDAEAWRVYYEGVKEYVSLTEAEKARFNFLMGMYFGIVDTLMVHEEAGTFIYPETYRRNLDQAYAVFRQPGVQKWWEVSGKGRVFAPKVENYLLERLRKENGAR